VTYERTMVPRPEDRDEWLEVRKPYFNASATAVLFNRHPYLSAGRYATVKLTGKEQDQTQAMLRGAMLEDGVAAWWALNHDREVAQVRDLFICERIMATLDRFVYQRPHQRVIAADSADPTPLEVKTTNRFVGADPEPYWLDQCQSILLCTDAPQMVLAWMDASLELRACTVAADVELQAQIVERAEWFMSAIDMGLVPEGVTLSYEDAGDVYPVAEVAKVEVDSEVWHACRRLAKARGERLAAEKAEDEAKGEIATVLGNAEVGLWQGAPIVEWRSIKPARRFNVRRFTEEHPDDAEEYVEEHPQRRMKVLVGDDPGEDEL
jgi:hypothetical protein